MFEIKRTKMVTLVPPQLKNNGAAAGNTYVDTLGFSHVRFAMITGTIDAIIGSTDTSTPLKVEECDTTDGSYTDVTSAAMAAVIPATGDDKINAVDVDLRKTHKRYMRLNAPTMGNGTTGCNFCAVAILSDPDEAPVAAAKAGLNTWVEA